LLSEQVAANLGLQVGDTIHNAIDPELYSNIPAPLEVVGILEGDVRLSVASYEYLNNHELYRRMVMPVLLVAARQGREAAVDDFLRREIEATGISVDTLQKLTEDLTADYRATYLLLLPVVAIVTVAILFVIGIVNRIAFAERVPEFGILNASGHSRKWLIRRLTLETGLLVFIGWMLGIGMAWVFLSLLKSALFAPRGHDLSVVSLVPAVPIIPVPIAVIGFTLISAGRVLSRLDPVTVVERGELSLEGDRRPGVPAAKSSPRPLASWTYFRRHRRQAVLSTGAMALMIVAVVVYMFLTAAIRDARKASLGHLSRVSIVGLHIGAGPNPGVAGQIRTHPAVERVIPFFRFTMLDIFIPPGETAPINPFGVYAEDMAYLVDLYDLELKQGHLPRPRTNELVIPEVVAQNRDLQVGYVIGDPDHPAYPGASIAVPTEFVISGIFARPEPPQEDNWLSFISLEFTESHETFDFPGDANRSLLVVPKAGQKKVLDDWLEEELASNEVQVQTYRQLAAKAQASTRTQILTIALLESVIAIVAASALAVLNYISVSQRRSEFGVLHALGYGRRQLVRRAMGEAVFTTVAAWGLSAALFLVGLVYLQFGVFRPMGLKLNVFNITPWLFTLPIPLAVLAVASATVARLLIRLDPVSIIERR
jgi:ABC-type antimicrobial peptide transport system permease subunit